MNFMLRAVVHTLLQMRRMLQKQRLVGEFWLRLFISCCKFADNLNYTSIQFNAKLRVPMKRLGSIDEVIKSVAYLLSDDSSYTTGTNLVVDGGLSSGLKA